ncbi:MAG: HNH endonuclease family protein [Myxococcota bacterium]
MLRPLRRLLRRFRWVIVIAIVLLWMKQQGWLEEVLPTELPGGGTPTQTEAPTNYDRDDWRHWTDADDDCQNTRHEVLEAESETPVSFKTNKHCKVTRGRWRCPYTGKVITDPSKLDVDHMVPLHEAHRSGGHAWSRERREIYANELSDAGHLVAVERGSNRAKSDKAPDHWMPANPAYRCDYVSEWVRIKDRWSLTMRDEERAFIERVQRACDEGRTPPAKP